MDQVAQQSQFGMLKVFPLIKADEKTHTVFGLVTAETPDKENETCDYEGAKKAYQDWSNEAKTATENSGQAISLGNIRVQHTDQVGGKATDIVYDDDEKQILVKSQPIDDAMWKAIADGFYTGYSQGGDYAERSCQECGATIPKSKGNYCGSCKKIVGVRYIPTIAEVSYVDNPCHGSAHFQFVKSDGTTKLVKFKARSESMEPEQSATSPSIAELVKSPEITELIKGVVSEVLRKEAKTKRVAGEDLTSDCFAYVGDKNDTSTWKLPIKFSTEEKTKSHIRNALARFNQTKGIPAGSKASVKSKIEAAAKKHGIESSDESKKADNVKELIKNFIEAKVAERLPATLRKDLYTVARFAGLINEIAYVLWSAQYEAEMELDASTIPDELQEDLENLVETFLAMAEEESNELTAATAERIGKVMKVDATGLEKAYNKAAGIVNKIKKAVSDHHEAIKKANSDHEEKVHGHLEDLKDCMCNSGSKAAKAAFSKAIPKTKAPDQDTDAEVDDQEEGEIEPIDPSEEGTENIAQKTFSAEDVEKIVNKSVQSVLKALAKKDDEEDDEEGEERPAKKVAKKKKPAEDDEEDEEEEPAPKSKKAAAGVGTRSSSPANGPQVRTMPITKSQDRQEEPSNRMTDTVKKGEVDPKTVRAAIQKGDVSAQLELMKGAKPQGQVPSTLASAVGALSKRR